MSPHHTLSYFHTASRFCVTLAGLGITTPAPADEPLEPQPFAVHYSAPTGCPSADELSRQVSSRLNSAPKRRKSSERVSHLWVVIAQESAGFMAELHFISDEGAEVFRQVVAPDCAQAVDGISLIAALAIESQPPPIGPPPPPELGSSKQDSPDASDPAQAAPAQAGPASSGQAAPSVPDATQPLSARAQHSEHLPTGPAAQRPSTTTRVDRAESHADSSGLGPGRSVAILAAVRSGLAPRLTPGAVIEGRFALPSTWSVLRVEALALDSFELEAAGARVRFRQVLAGVGACASQAIATPSLRFEPCLGVELGLYAAQGYADDRRVVREHRVNRPWAAGALGLWLRAEFQPLFVTAGVEAHLPFLRSQYELTQPTQRVHEVPAWAYGLATGAGLSF